MPRREIEITTLRTPNGYLAWMSDDSHNPVTRTYEVCADSRAMAFENCRSYAQGSQVSLVGQTAAWWHLTGEIGTAEPLDAVCPRDLDGAALENWREVYANLQANIVPA